MIINIRGTSGSGKSTLVRRVLECYESKSVFREEKRKQPIGYLYHRTGGKSLAVIGHYESPCGGCDTIPKMEKIFDLVRQSYAAGHDVIFEGLLISADVKRTMELFSEGLPLKVIALDTPIEVCVESINLRRRAKNPDKEDVNPKNTESKHKGVKGSMVKFEAAGMNAVFASRDEAFNIIKQELNLCQ